MIRIVLALLLVPSLAHAEHDTTVQLVAGGEVLGGSGALSSGFRGHALVGRSFGGGPARPELALGLTFGSGYLGVDDMRALDGSVDLSLTTFGPEARVGIRFANGGFIDNRIYASFAALRVNKDRRLALDAVPGVSGSGNRGYRASLGASWVDAIGKAATKETGYASKEDAAAVFIVLLPSQAEIAWERDAGSDRMGVMLGWGI